MESTGDDSVESGEVSFSAAATRCFALSSMVIRPVEEMSLSFSSPELSLSTIPLKLISAELYWLNGGEEDSLLLSFNLVHPVAVFANIIIDEPT